MSGPHITTVLLAFVAIVLLFKNEHEPFTATDHLAARQIAEWRAPTDFLLHTPGRELLTTVPSIPSKGVLR